ncbi:hypothetical protein CBER1_04107 [Cercospora berteroae]|uniref:Chromo domain-containing protein n=1 Tax=Cercospora berteroae TaxID=357750 RepID=A0A2S6CGR0_9PEZI|nr:hypothetical protein CBER1_04107 [Cercospora berteroae]
MPAPLHSDGSDVDIPDAIPAKAVENQPEESEDDDDAEDEYAVEKILSHNFVKGKAIYEIKWVGYDDEADRTWEPIENLEEGAKELLEAYHRKIGGTPEAPKKGKPGKKSLGKRASSAMEESPAPTSSKKGRSRKSETNGSEWTPPLGLWEDHVTRVTAIIEGDEVDEDGTINKTKGVQTLEGLLEWNNGRKTQHKMPVLRQKCPQRLLDYYEGHLLKPKLEALEEDDPVY